MSKRRHNFGTKRFKEKSLFKFHARIVLKSLILLFVRLIARGARIGKTHTQTHRHTDRQTHRQNEYCNPRACAPRVNYIENPCIEQTRKLASLLIMCAPVFHAINASARAVNSDLERAWGVRVLPKPPPLISGRAD